MKSIESRSGHGGSTRPVHHLWAGIRFDRVASNAMDSPVGDDRKSRDTINGNYEFALAA